MNVGKARGCLEDFVKEAQDKSTEFIRDVVISGKVSKSHLNVTLPATIDVDGLPKNFTPSQRDAVR